MLWACVPDLIHSLYFVRHPILQHDHYSMGIKRSGNAQCKKAVLEM